MDEQQFHTPTGWRVSESIPGDNTTHDGRYPFTLPDHLIALPDTSWSFWRWSGYAGRAFPASLALQLAMPTCAAAADLLLVREAEVEEARTQAFALLSDEIKDAQGETRMLLIEARRQVKYGKLPMLVGEHGDARSPLHSLSSQLRRAWTGYRWHTLAESRLALNYERDTIGQRSRRCGYWLR